MKLLTFHNIIFISYFILSFVVTFALVFKEKPKNKIISAAIVFWLLTFNIYKSPVMWKKIPYIWYFRNADYLLGWFLTAVLVLVIISRIRNEEKMKTPNFEKYFYIYIFFCMGMIGLHFFLGNISGYKASSLIRLYVNSFLLYYTFKFFMTKELLRMIFWAIIFMGIVTAFASLYQFFIDTEFFRIGYFHMAFPGYNRSSGIFYYAYDNGLFQILALYTTIYFLKDWRIKIPLIATFLVTLFLVFTRGTWLSFIIVLLFHLTYFYGNEFKRILTTIAIGAVLITLITGAYFAQEEFFTGAYTERVKSDTVTVRMTFYYFVLKAIPEKLFTGYGDVENNDVYFKGMVNAEQSLFWALGRAGGIHNLFLEEAFLRGIFSPIILSMVFISFFFFTVKMSLKTKNYIFCIPGYFNTGLFFYFMSVSGFLISRSSVLSLLMLGIVSGIYYNKIDISDVLIKSKFNVLNGSGKNTGLKNINVVATS
jgi:hypothetical protein